MEQKKMALQEHEGEAGKESRSNVQQDLIWDAAELAVRLRALGAIVDLVEICFRLYVREGRKFPLHHKNTVNSGPKWDQYSSLPAYILSLLSFMTL